MMKIFKRRMKDNDHFRNQIKDLTAQLMEARRELDRMTAMAADPKPDQE